MPRRGGEQGEAVDVCQGSVVVLDGLNGGQSRLGEVAVFQPGNADHPGAVRAGHVQKVEPALIVLEEPVLAQIRHGGGNKHDSQIFRHQLQGEVRFVPHEKQLGLKACGIAEALHHGGKHRGAVVENKPFPGQGGKLRRGLDGQRVPDAYRQPVLLPEQRLPGQVNGVFRLGADGKIRPVGLQLPAHFHGVGQLVEDLHFWMLDHILPEKAGNQLLGGGQQLHVARLRRGVVRGLPERIVIDGEHF